MKERAAGGWWLQGGDIHRYYMYKGGCPPPAQPPGGLDWLMGVGCIRGAAPLGVSPPDPWLRVPPRAWGWECRLAGPCTLEG